MYCDNELLKTLTMRGRGNIFAGQDHSIDISGLYRMTYNDVVEVKQAQEEGKEIFDKAVKIYSFLTASLRKIDEKNYIKSAMQVSSKELKANLVKVLNENKKSWLDIPNDGTSILNLMRYCGKSGEKRATLPTVHSGYNVKKKDGSQLTIATYNEKSKFYTHATHNASKGSRATVFVPTDKISLFYINRSKCISPKTKRGITLATLDLFSRLNPHFDENKNKVVSPIQVQINLPYSTRILASGLSISEEYKQGFEYMADLLKDDCTLTINPVLNTCLQVTLSV